MRKYRFDFIFSLRRTLKSKRKLSGIIKVASFPGTLLPAPTPCGLEEERPQWERGWWAQVEAKKIKKQKNIKIRVFYTVRS